MKDKQLVSNLLYAILFAGLFMLLQIGFTTLGAVAYSFAAHIDFAAVMASLQTGENSILLSVTTALSSIATIILFLKRDWANVSNTYLKTHPWGVVIWAALLALGSILPFEYIYERINISMPEHYQELFQNIMKEPWGYIVIGILAPITEELVFRGAILRALLKGFGTYKHWVAIFVSALIFGLIHMNLAQGVHAFFLGLVLGWMYYRTDSIIPGIALHWVNNTVAYLMFHLMPQMSDGKLIDFFHGSDKLMYGGLFFSLCIFIPSLFQLALRMKKAK